MKLSDRFLSVCNINYFMELKEWTSEELLKFQTILHKTTSEEIDINETKEILNRLYSCFLMMVE